VNHLARGSVSGENKKRWDVRPLKKEPRKVRADTILIPKSTVIPQIRLEARHVLGCKGTKYQQKKKGRYYYNCLRSLKRFVAVLIIHVRHPIN